MEDAEMLAHGPEILANTRRRHQFAAMSMTATIILLTSSAAVFGVANWRSRKPYELGKPDPVPWVLIQFAAILGIVLMLAHLVSLLTGQPFTGRFSR